MATCLDIISGALREIGVIASGEAPTAAEAADCLVRLQAVVDGMWGAGIGGSLTDQDITASATLLPDTRALVSASSPITLTLPATPANGARIQVKDMLSSFAASNVTLAGNGRLIELSSTKLLNTNGTDTTWVYNSGAANWAKVSPLGLSDIPPIGDDEFFILVLAKRVAAMFGAQFQSEEALLRAANRIRAKFSAEVVIPADDGVRFMSRQSWRHGMIGPTN